LSEPRVELTAVSKRYVLGHGQGVRGALLSLAGRYGRDDLWALREVSLKLERGESLGLVGRNGAGKTTLLRLIAGISRPTHGHVRTNGRIASLLNVGAGFLPDLSGRDNVFVNGVILGLTRRQIYDRYDAIVEFAGVERFMDTPVKHFSSGMYARLAFAIAAHADPDVLLVDEVLSVGDATFQDRSLRRMLDFRDRGHGGVVFVSHNLAAVELMCERCVWLERGVVRAAGESAEVIRAYLDAVDDIGENLGDTYLTADCVEVLDGHGRPTDCLAADAPFSVRISGRAVRELIEPVFVVTIRGDHGPLFAGNMHIDGSWPTHIPVGPFTVTCNFGPSRLAPGRYRVELKVKQNVRTNYYEPRVKAFFDVPGPVLDTGADVCATWQSDAIIGRA
jgi:lipopolysaccharide transport system ATP-binding protein